MKSTAYRFSVSPVFVILGLCSGLAGVLSALGAGKTRSRAEFRIYQLVVMGSLIIAAVSIDRLMGQAK